jgi:hypothetical protein
MSDRQSESPRDLSAAEHPRCSTCPEAPMLLSRIEAGPSGYDYRTFGCQQCGRVHTMIVSGDPLESDMNGWLLGETRPPNPHPKSKSA